MQKQTFAMVRHLGRYGLKPAIRCRLPLRPSPLFRTGATGMGDGITTGAASGRGHAAVVSALPAGVGKT